MDSEGVEAGVGADDAPVEVPAVPEVEVARDVDRGEPDGLSEPERESEACVPDTVDNRTETRSPLLEASDPKEAKEMIITQLKTGQPRASLKKYQKPSNTFVVGP